MTDRTQRAVPAWNSQAEVLGGWRWEVWLRWVAYTTVGYFLKGLMTTAAPMRTPRDLAMAPVVGALGLGVVGFLQWVTLRRYLNGVRWWNWVAATVLGQLAATIVVTLAVTGPLLLGALTPVVKYIGASALQVVTRVVTGGLLGAVLGFAQWLVLRRYLQAAVWWIPATFLAGAAVALMPPIALPGSSLGRVGIPLTTQLIIGLIVGSITGWTLIWLLRKPQKGPVTRGLPIQ